MSDFSDTPFVAGSLTGLRAFGVDYLGRLHGPSFKQVFKPGENVADCRKDENVNISTLLFASNPWAGSYEAQMRRFLGLPAGGATSMKLSSGGEVKVTDDSPAHRVGQQDCTCGFYAYFDGTNTYKQNDRVSAIIEGYGVCTVGTRGFRAEKARLLALIMKPSKRDRFPLVLRNYPDVPVFNHVDEAVAAHPLSDLAPTPDDEGFWTEPVR